MKRYVVIICLLFVVLDVSADLTIKQRDSVLSRIEAMPLDSARIDYAMFQQRMYVKTTFARHFVDRLYADARALGHRKAELLALNAYCNLSIRPVLDRDQAQKELERLRQRSYDFQTYDIYFRCARAYLSRMSFYGNTEHVAYEARKLKKEAEELGCEMGVVCAQLALVSAYKFARDDQQVIAALNETLTLPGIDHRELLSIYFDLSLAYANTKQYTKFVESLSRQREIVDQMIARDARNTVIMRSQLFIIEAMYIDAYMYLNDYEQAGRHLENAQRYYRDDCDVSSFAIYHTARASYNAHYRRWKECFAAVDTALTRLTSDQYALLRSDVLKRKVSFLEKVGSLSQAISLHEYILAQTDSLAEDFAGKQHSAIYNNYRWDSEVLRHAENASLIYLILIISLSVFVLVALWFVVRLFIVFRRKQIAKEEIRKASQMAQTADTLKEVFLNNIAREMKQPVAQIHKNVEMLASASVLQVSDRIDVLNSSVKHLSAVVDSVLELSQLEAGTLKFDLEKQNVVALCYDAIGRINPQNSDEPSVDIQFVSYVDSQMLNIDCRRFVDCLISVLFVPVEYRLSCNITFTLSYTEDGQAVILDVVGSPLANIRFEGQMQELQNEINRLFFESFDGVYDLTVSNLRPRIAITIPHNDL